jgi:hypothetical protein
MGITLYPRIHPLEILRSRSPIPFDVRLGAPPAVIHTIVAESRLGATLNSMVENRNMAIVTIFLSKML